MNVLSEILAQCQLNPQRNAFIEDQRTVSREVFLHRYCTLAIMIGEVTTGIRPVAIALDRGIDAAVAIFAVLHAGRCYVPLDMKNPPSRLRFFVQDADAETVIGQGPKPDWVPAEIYWMDTEFKKSISDPHVIPESVSAETPAAILYTSGSTGTPKGVVLSHGAMLNFAVWSAQTFLADQPHRAASLAPFHFDLSVFDLFACLSTGSTVEFVPARLTLTPGQLTDWMQYRKITIWYTVPSLLAFIAYKGKLESTPLPALKTIMFAGEIFSTSSLRTLADKLPGVDLYNLFGPTETNVCSYWKVDRARLSQNAPIPIGEPACSAELRIDRASGELLVRSKSNFSGYWKRGKLAEVQFPGSWYRTGDRVSKNEYDEFCYHGRLDRMLKSSGYRIEPAEIEAAIRQQPAVLNCAVIGIRDPATGHRIAAVIELRCADTLSTVVTGLKSRLPPYMLPTIYKVVDRLPCLSNGKIDYEVLQKQIGNI